MIIQIENGELITNDWPDFRTSDISDYLGGRFRSLPVPRAVADLSVIAYMNDDPVDLPWNFELPGVGRIRGNVVIVGLSEHGDIRQLEHREWTAYRLVDIPNRALPILEVNK